MKNILDLLELHILCPVCIRCHSFQVRPSLFCKPCEDTFLKIYLKKHYRSLLIGGQNYEVQSMIQWPPFKSDSISAMVYLLKSRLSRSAWNNYAQFFDFLPLATSSTIYIPVPSRKINKAAFHTMHFAQALSQRFGGQVLNCLKNSTKTSARNNQKDQDYHGRSQVDFLFIEEFTKELSHSDRIILIDDIITTGFTLSACIEALHSAVPRSLQIDILTLFSREKI